jgi:PAS domain-containing protein
VIARDPTSFLEMLAQAPFMAWRTSGAGKLEWANEAYLAALDSKSLDQAINRNLSLDHTAVDHARSVIESGEQREDVRKVALGGELRSLRILMLPVAGGAAGMAFDVTDADAAREQLSRQSKAHDETLNHLAEGVAVFDASKRLVFHNRAFEEMWGLEPVFLAERPTHAQWLDHLVSAALLRGEIPAAAMPGMFLTPAQELALWQAAIRADIDSNADSSVEDGGESAGAVAGATSIPSEADAEASIYLRFEIIILNASSAS